MKKLFKAILLIAVVACCAVAIAFAGCGDNGKEGEYHYTSYGHEYGIKVSVVVDGDVIKSVSVVKSNYVEVSEPPEGNEKWTQASVDNWNNNLPGLLKKYEGKKVADVLAIEVTKEGDVPKTVADSNLVITGATQGSGRLLLAIQDALK